MIMSRRFSGCPGGLVKFESVGIALTPEDVVEQPVGFYQFVDHLLFTRVESFGVEWHLNGTELSQNGGNAQGRQQQRQYADWHAHTGILADVFANDRRPRQLRINWGQHDYHSPGQ